MGSPRANFSFLSVFSFIAVVQKNGKGGFFIEKLANMDGSTPHKLYNNEKKKKPKGRTCYFVNFGDKEFVFMFGFFNEVKDCGR